MSSKYYNYDTVQYDDLSGLDGFSMKLPVTDRDALQKTTWEVHYGHPQGDPENYGIEDDDPFIFIPVSEVDEDAIPWKALDMVYPDILHPLVDDIEVRIPEDVIPPEGESIVIAELEATWKDLKGMWRLAQRRFELTDEVSS
jgi:hypothetical protein